jgi:glutathione S-transferase
LITGDGKTLLDSSVICEYLDCLHDGPPLFSPAGDVRWQALRWQVLGGGILGASVLRRVEDKFREEHLHSADWIARQKKTI